MLRVQNLATAGFPPVSTDVAAGQWVTLGHADPPGLLAAIAGDAQAGVGHGRVLLAGQDLSHQPASRRARAGLATCPGRLPDLPGLRVMDVLLVARSESLRGLSWRAALGSRQARAALADAEADARALAARLGIGDWVDAQAVGLPPQVAARADLVRALVGAPRALVWAVPATGADGHATARPGAAPTLADALAAEQKRLGMAVLAVEPTLRR